MNVEQTTPEQASKRLPTTVTPSNETPASLQHTIDSIQGFVYDPDLLNDDDSNDDKAPPQNVQEPKAAAAQVLMMFNARATTLPSLRTEAWTHSKADRPNPVSISEARKLLADGYAAIPCELDGTGDHGYAWMIEEKATWKRREGVNEDIEIPTKPTKGKLYSVEQQLEYADKMEEYKMYTHLVHEGRLKLIEWFGKSMFADMHVNGSLPTTATPRELLLHLSATYAKGRDHRRHLEQVEKNFRTAYDPKQPVELYFMKLEEACDQAELLGQPYTEEQTINEALKNFEKQYPNDVYKAEERWREKDITEQTWQNFKTYWKEKIHGWVTSGRATKHAYHVEEVNRLAEQLSNMQRSVTALQADNRSYHEQNSALIARQVEFQNALQAEQLRRCGISDDISAITELLSPARLGYNTSTSSSGSVSTINTRPRNEQELLEIAKRRAPDSYRHLNDGKGLQYNKYCWKCGCNCTHNTNRCYELTDEQRARYGDASFTNTMNGNARHLNRKDKWQRDFNYDSL